MRDGVWDRVSRSIRKTNHNNPISRLFGASHRHLSPKIPQRNLKDSSSWRIRVTGCNPAQRLMAPPADFTVMPRPFVICWRPHPTPAHYPDR